MKQNRSESTASVGWRESCTSMERELLHSDSGMPRSIITAMKCNQILTLLFSCRKIEDRSLWVPPAIRSTASETLRVCGFGRHEKILRHGLTQ